MDTSQRRVSALILLSTALISASFVPVLAGAAPALWTAALAVAVGAVCLAMRLRAPKARETPRPKSGGFGVLVLVVLFVVGALVGSVLVQAPGAHAAPARGLGVSEAAVVSEEAAVSQAQLVDFAERQSGLIPIVGDEARDLIARAHRADTRPRSGLRPDYANAHTFRSGSAAIVSLPLLGTDLPQVSNLTFITSGATLDVIENAASLIDEDHAVYRSWTNGSLVRDVVLTRPGSDSAESVSVRGFSMDKLKKCLNENGIAWAVLLVVGVSCSAACATAVLCLPCVALYAGISGGALSKCVSYAFS